MMNESEFEKEVDSILVSRESLSIAAGLSMIAALTQMPEAKPLIEKVLDDVSQGNLEHREYAVNMINDGIRFIESVGQRSEKACKRKHPEINN